MNSSPVYCSNKRARILLTRHGAPGSGSLTESSPSSHWLLLLATVGLLMPRAVLQTPVISPRRGKGNRCDIKRLAQHTRFVDHVFVEFHAGPVHLYKSILRTIFTLTVRWLDSSF